MPRPPAPTLLVTFHRPTDERHLSWWEATRPRGGRIRGGHMPIGHGIIPHDMGHLAVEAHLGIGDGFWGLLARGATFKRGTDRRPTRTGRALVRDHREGLARAEALGNAHHVVWARGGASPAAPTLDRLAALWASVPRGGTLTLRWPTLDLVDTPAPSPR